MSLFSRASAASLSSSFVLTLAFSSTSFAASVYVANNGTDSGSCGAKTAPCRSITQGIANSAVGGKIVVGPGRYGDLNNNGILGEPGEEPLATCNAAPCMINVDKKVSIASSDGAFSTVITGGSAAISATVALAADGIVFGGISHGFTVETPGGPSAGVIVAQPPTVGVTVAGNVISVATFAGLGIELTQDSQAVGNRIVGTGIYGIAVVGNGVLLSGNTVGGWNVGYYVNGNSAVFTGNVAHGNNVGLVISGTAFTVTKSSFVGNSLNGMVVGLGGTGAVTASNFYGNDPASNCGLDANSTSVTATNCWWGAASGPGSQPANNICNAMAGVATPFAVVPAKVKPKAIR